MDPFNIKHPIDEELDARLIEAIGTADHDHNKYHPTFITNPPQITLLSIPTQFEPIFILRKNWFDMYQGYPYFIIQR